MHVFARRSRLQRTVGRHRDRALHVPEQREPVRGRGRQRGVAGRPIAFVESGADREYVLASAAAEVVMPPTGELMLVGLHLEALYLKELLGSVGVSADFEAIGKYKSAAETITRTEPSPEARDAMTALLDAAVRAVSWCQRIPGGHWFVAPPSPWWLAGYYGLLGLSGLNRRFGWSHGRLLACWLAGLALWAWSAVVWQALESRWLRIDILDVGHGDSLLVRTPAGHTLLIDAGTREAGRSRVVPFLRDAGITALDALVLTHTDEDHLGGAIPVLAALPVRRLLTNGVRDDTMSARQVRRLAALRGVPETVLAAGMTLADDPGTRLEVLHPPAGLVPGTAPASNDNSLVLKATRGAVSVLLSGDIEEAGLPWLLRAEDATLRASVLKVPHHGSRLGRAGEELFRRVRPALAVVSVGRAHRLPAPETLEALRGAGAMVVSTREEGAVQLRTDGRRLEVRTFRTKHHRTYCGL